MKVLTGHFAKHWRRAQRVHARYRNNEEGATAVEFGIVAIPFLAIIFAILELALVFFTGAVLTQSMSETGRLVRTGQFQGCGQIDEFKALVCDGMSNLMNCEANLRLDLVTAASFQTVTMPDPGMSGLDPDDEDKKIQNGTYEETGPAEPVVLRGTFYYPLALPNFMTRLENEPGSGRHVISVATAFRNEPFPGGGSCNRSLLERIQDTVDDVVGDVGAIL